jgi:hypothetical protein
MHCAWPGSHPPGTPVSAPDPMVVMRDVDMAIADHWGPCTGDPRPSSRRLMRTAQSCARTSAVLTALDCILPDAGPTLAVHTQERHPQEWQAGSAALLAFAARHGHCHVPAALRRGQRPPSGSAWARGSPADERRLIPNSYRARLESLPGWCRDLGRNAFNADVAALCPRGLRRATCRCPTGTSRARSGWTWSSNASRVRSTS